MTTKENKKSGETQRPYISLLFRCCNVYQRIYRHRDKARYEGYCPRCMRHIEVPIGPKGTSQRFFEAE